MGAVAWCIELAFIASLMLVYNIQWNRALSARSASGTGKSVWATRRAIRGMDFACAEDADGSTPDACQIRYTAPRRTRCAARVRIGCGCSLQPPSISAQVRHAVHRAIPAVQAAAAVPRGGAQRRGQLRYAQAPALTLNPGFELSLNPNSSPGPWPQP